MDVSLLKKAKANDQLTYSTCVFKCLNALVIFSFGFSCS
jgi:hypothetical protein